MRLTDETMIGAMQRCDAAYNGCFYVGVHSTGIYCLPSCKAKQPLLKNIRFYVTREEAIAAGLRGCKRCRSERYPDVLPEWMHRLIGFMREQHGCRFHESDLAGMAGVDITTIRRYFRSHLQTTALAFHRRIRLNHARRLLEQGRNFLSVAFEIGYESSSGFREAFEKQFGVPPGCRQLPSSDLLHEQCLQHSILGQSYDRLP